MPINHTPLHPFVWTMVTNTTSLTLLAKFEPSLAETGWATLRGLRTLQWLVVRNNLSGFQSFHLLVVVTAWQNNYWLQLHADWTAGRHRVCRVRIASRSLDALILRLLTTRVLSSHEALLWHDKLCHELHHFMLPTSGVSVVDKEIAGDVFGKLARHNCCARTLDTGEELPTDIRSTTEISSRTLRRQNH